MAGGDLTPDPARAPAEVHEEHERLASLLGAAARAAVRATGARTASATLVPRDGGHALVATARQPVGVGVPSPVPDGTERVLSVPLEDVDGPPRGTLSIAGGPATETADRGVLSEIALLVRHAVDAVDALESWSAERARRADVVEEAWRPTRELTDELRRTVDQLDMALEAGQMGTWRWDLEAGEAHWSEGFEALCGYEHGSLPRTVDAHLSIVHPEDRDSVREQLERAREARAAFRYRCRILRPDGAVRWIDGAGQPVIGEGLAPSLVGVVTDVTETVVGQQRIEHERHLTETMHELGKAVVARLDWDELVEVVTRAGMRSTSARFGAFVTSEPGDSTRVRAHSLQGSPAQGAASLTTAAELIGLDRALQGETVLHDDLRAEVGDRDRSRPAAPVPLRSSLAVPVTSVHGEVLGALAFGHPAPRAFDADHLRVIEGIASQAAIAVDNARLYRSVQRQLEVRQRAFEERDHVAQVLQHSLLPPELPRIPGVELAGRYRPGSHEIGGDFYDVVPVEPDGWVVAVGDVCGKGPEAAGLTALARHTLRTAGMLGRPPEEALELLNRALLLEPDEHTSCSALFAHLCLDDGTVVLDLALAGHPPPLVLRAEGDVDRVGLHGTMLGVVDDIEVSESRVRLERGDLLALYTDGVIEARGGHGLFGIEGLSDLLRACRGLGAAEVAAAIEGRVELMGPRRARDDVAVLAVLVE